MIVKWLILNYKMINPEKQLILENLICSKNQYNNSELQIFFSTVIPYKFNLEKLGFH